MAVTLEQFRQQLTDCGLLTPDDAAALISGATGDAPPKDAEEFARLLVKRKRLTAYQAQQIYAGRGKSLVLGNYLVTDKLGQGGMGMVLKAQHRRMNRVVALKLLSPTLTKSSELVGRFHREAQAAARLDHPNIVAAYDADEAQGVHFLAMQFVDGQDLSAIVRARGPLPVATAVDYVLQAAQGFEYAHKRGVIHRDIKPSNLLVGRDGTVRILDMGLARIDDPHADRSTDHSLTGTGTVMGTIDYMSPEQALNTKHADAKSDQYSLGITLYFLLTGRAAYGGDTVMEKLLAHREAPLPSLVDALSTGSPGVATPGLQAQLNGIFQRMIAKKPADRFASMDEVIHELTELTAMLSGESGITSPATAPPLTDASPQVDPALAAFLEHSPRATATAISIASATAQPSIAESPTLLTSGPIEQTAMLTRSSPPVRPRRALAVWGGVAAVVIAGVGWAAWHLASKSQTPDRPSVAGKAEAKQTATDALPIPVTGQQEESDIEVDDSHRTEGIHPIVELSTHRRTLDWVRSVGGKVTLIAGGRTITLGRSSPYPANSFEVNKIDLALARVNAPEDLKPLANLPASYFLVLPEIFTEAQSAQALLVTRQTSDVMISSIDRAFTSRFSETIGEYPLRYLVVLGQEVRPGSLAALGKLPRLQHLLLKGCSVTPEVLREVEDIPHLTHLNLESSTITGAHLQALTLPGLEVLMVFGTSVNVDDLVEFRRRHPRVGFGGIDGIQAELDRRQAEEMAHAQSLLFDGDGDFVEVAEFPRCDGEPVTLEAWVQPGVADDAANVVTWLGPNWVSIFQSGRFWGLAQRLDDESRVRQSDVEVVPGEWTHLAATFADGELTLYVNGKSAATRPIAFELEPTEQGLYLGGCPVEKLQHDGERWFSGGMRQARITRGVLYAGDFEPAAGLVANQDSLACFDFQQRDGDVLTDSSGQGRHGKIVGAKWSPDE